MKIQNLFLATLITITSLNAIAQDTNQADHTLSIEIPEIALLDIESKDGNNISLTATAPTEAGDKVIFEQTNSDLWINYSSIVGSKETRQVTVQITDGNVPDGIELTVMATNDAGSGEGTMGKAAKAPIVLNDKKATNIIDGVGSAYTGNGASKGHNLTYKIAQSDDKDSYSKLNFDQSTSITITYTLTDI